MFYKIFLESTGKERKTTKSEKEFRRKKTKNSSKKIKEEKVFAYTAMRLREIGAEV